MYEAASVSLSYPEEPGEIGGLGRIVHMIALLLTALQDPLCGSTLFCLFACCRAISSLLAGRLRNGKQASCCAL